MRKAGPGRPAIHNWRQIRDDLEQSGKTLVAYCEEKNLSYTFTSRELKALDMEDAERHLQLAKRKLARNAPLAADQLTDLLGNEDDNIKLKAIAQVLDRVGLSAQAINLQVNNINSVQNISIPIFSAEVKPLLDKFLGAKNADAESDS